MFSSRQGFDFGVNRVKKGGRVVNTYYEKIIQNLRFPAEGERLQVMTRIMNKKIKKPDRGSSPARESCLSRSKGQPRFERRGPRAQKSHR